MHTFVHFALSECMTAPNTPRLLIPVEYTYPTPFTYLLSERTYFEKHKPAPLPHVSLTATIDNTNSMPIIYRK